MQTTTMNKEFPQAAPATVKYLCPMCPGVVSNEAGDCPRCGMVLERNPAWKPAQSKNTHTCPMHPEVQQDHPGDFQVRQHDAAAHFKRPLARMTRRTPNYVT